MIELISIHIPKTAGRSFLAILNSVYDRNSIAHFEHTNYADKTISEIEQFKSQLNDNIRIIHGHFHYKDINDLKDVKNAKIITWLRQPVERVISNYSFFIKRVSESNDTNLQKRKNESLIEYATLENSRNRMSKFIAGLEINKFFFIGITEYFDNDIERLSKMLNWGPIQVPRINDNSEFKSQLPEITKEELNKIEALNKDDIELYSRILRMHSKNLI